MSDETGDNFDLKNYKTFVMQKHINELLQAGYTDVTRNSGVGSTILFHPATKRIAKFNQDPAYDKFIEFVRQHPQPCFPKVDSHERPAGQFDDPDFPYANDRYSLTIMELLTPIELDVESQIVSWVGDAIPLSNFANNGIPDTFGLATGLNALVIHAKTCGVGLDNKVTNYMYRLTPAGRCYVFIDPYHG